MKANKTLKRIRRKKRIRSKIFGTSERPRLLVYRSLSNTYAQLIDDEKQVVITSCSDIKEKSKDTKVVKATKVGQEIGKKAIEKNIKSVVFDRNGYQYHGRVKALADGAREAGLNF